MIDDKLKGQILRHYLVDKWTVSAIAGHLLVHHSTVQKALAGAGVDVHHAPRARMVDPYMPFMMEKLEQYPRLHASRLYQMVKDLGYRGKPDHFRGVVAQVRPRPPAKAYLRLQTLPGEQGQVDWGYFGKLRVGNRMHQLSALVMVLSYSRQVFLQFYLGQHMSLFLLGHQQAFEFFEGVPRVLLYDNLKSVVLERQGEAIHFNPQFLQFAAHHLFEPRPVTVRRGNQKGRVERAIQYIRHAFFAAREFKDVADLNAQALHFCLGLSQERRLPQDRTQTVKEAFEQERPLLIPLPKVPYPVEHTTSASVGKTPYVRFDKNDYTVPHDQVGRTLEVRATLSSVRILLQGQVLATHERSYEQGKLVEDPKHIEALLKQKQDASLHRGIGYLQNRVPRSQLFLQHLAERGGNLGSATAALLRLMAHYGAEEMDAAVQEALEHGTIHVGAIRHVLDLRWQQLHRPPPVAVTLPDDPRLAQLSVTPHRLSSYDTLTQETQDEPDPTDLF
jgi:transposase